MRDIALALFVFGTIPFILTRPYIGLLVWSWLGYMNPNRLTFGFAYDFPWVQIIAIVTLVSLFASKERKRIPLSSISILLFVFLAWTGIATLFAVDPVAAHAHFMRFTKVMVMVFVTLALVNTRERMHWLVWVIVISLGFYGFKGGLFTLLTGGSHHVLGPPRSFIGDTNGLALALCMTVPLIRYLQLQTEGRWRRRALGVFMVLTAIAVLGTYSRGGFVELSAVIAALILKSRRRFVIIIPLVLIVLVAYQFMPAKWAARMNTLHDPTQVNSMQTRIQSWEFAANVAVHRPLTGGGFEVYKSDAMWATYGPPGARERAIHSVYFRVLGEQGFPGLILYLALLVFSWRSCSKVRNRARGSPAHKWAFDMASMLQVSLLAFLVGGLVTTLSYFDLTYQLMAMCVLLRILFETSAARSQAPSIAAGVPGERFGTDPRRGLPDPTAHNGSHV